MDELWTVKFSLLMRDIAESDTPGVDGEMLVRGHNIFDVLEKAKQWLAGFGYDIVTIAIDGASRYGFDKKGEKENE